MASVLFTKLAMTIGRDEVYVVAVPLRATKGPAQLVMSAAHSLNLWDLQHFMVLIKPSSPPPSSQALVFDFQPKDPENILVALEVISGKAVPGVLHMRKLRKLPRSKCWYVGSSEVDAVDVACKFNKSWETNLRVGHHDCRDYTNGLVEYLTGQKNVLERLRRSSGCLS
ncbi:hypothetical protein CJ030_MR6G006733 [Morella rubra]|uniref:PTB domain-containing engulfment adapter protein 1 n=1 Tax=Morella rubra TaxID=262757 RepID=A0A6A1V770_9ROSI|nr:hypothetical protein CJ030_MR6G006730 [Morella rubra]KAB1208692.1 hypothetical protein CJ030_MR6G006733 [Morella rubra]